MSNPVVGIIMGSEKDLEAMVDAAKTLEEFGVAYEVRIVSAHRTPDVMVQYAAEAPGRGLKVIIAGAGGSAHLGGMTASETILPVIAVPVKLPHHDHEALWSNIKMPTGVPLATVGENNSKNAALLAVRILALSDNELAQKYTDFAQKLHDSVLDTDARLQSEGWQSFLNK